MNENLNERTRANASRTKAAGEVSAASPRINAAKADRTDAAVVAGAVSRAKAAFASALFAILLAFSLSGLSGCAPGQAAESNDATGAPAAASSAVATDETDAGIEGLSPIPEFAGEPYVKIGNGKATFTAEELAQGTFESYAPLDSLSRATQAYALVSDETRPASGEKRASISHIHPSGWCQHSYDCVQGGSLYNRSHLIAWSLAAENDNPANLITGTTYMNQDTMQQFELPILDYIRNTGKHVLMRVTPIYEGDELVCRGVQFEAKSVEDDGATIDWNYFLFNVQPGVAIDYATGENWLDESVGAGAGGSGADDGAAGSQAEAGAGAAAGSAAAGAAASQHHSENHALHHGSTTASTCDYVLNTNTKKFHYPSCSSVQKMKAKNKQTCTSTRDEVIGQGYSPCGICHP